MSPQRNDELPKTPPPWMRQTEAADYLRVSTVTFRQRVRDGRLPGPYTGSGHQLWSRAELDQAVRGGPAADAAPPEREAEEDDPVDAVRRALDADPPPKKRRTLPPFR